MGLTTQTFDILTRIAIGNGALVYRAVEKSSLRQVALKLLTQDGDLDHRLDLDALFADAARLKAIYGAHVCQLLDAYADEDGPVLVYEFASGLNGAELPQQKKLTAVQCLDVAAQLISALRSGERQRMPHGDLKPSNVIFNDLPEGRPFTFVLDWGLAAYRQALRDDSLHYLAPERLHGAPPSHAADLFAAGAVLFYLYTGKVLVAGGSNEQVHAAWQKVRPEVLAELRPDLSPKLVQWVCQLLELDPAKRPPSAVEASSVLAGMNPPPPVAPPESIRPRPVAAPTRFPVPAAAPSSVIAPPPRRSGIRPPPAVTAPPAPVPVPRPRVPARPAKKSQLPAVMMGALLAAAMGGGMWFFLRPKDKEVKEPARTADTTPSRAAADSVTAPAPKAQQRLTAAEEKAAAKSNKQSPPKSSPPKTAFNTPPKSAAPAPTNGARPNLPPPKDEKVIIATESFAYNKGTGFAGLSGGGGWAGPWKGVGGTTDDKSFSAGKAPGSGGSVKLGPTENEVRWSRAIGPVSRFMENPAAGGHWYFAATLRHHSGIPGGGGEFIINPFSAEDPTAFVRIVVNDNGRATQFALNGNKTTMDVVDNGAPISLVLHISAKPAPGGTYEVTAKLAVNPNFSSPGFPTDPEQLIVCTVPAQRLPTQLGLTLLKKRGQADTQIDEIRYTRHWETVSGQQQGKVEN